MFPVFLNLMAKCIFFLIKPITSEKITKKIHLAIKLSSDKKEKIKKYNFELAEKFTYEYYINRIKNEIFEINI